MEKVLDSDGKLLIANNIFFKEVKEYLAGGKEVLFTINGNSMRPFLAHGDKVLISPFQYKHLSYGKIILAKSAYGYVLHRLVWKNKSKIWLAGDNNLVQLEEVKKDEILGAVKYAVIDGEHVDVHSFGRLFLAMIWFLIRPLRLVLFKFKKLF